MTRKRKFYPTPKCQKCSSTDHFPSCYIDWFWILSLSPFLFHKTQEVKYVESIGTDSYSYNHCHTIFFVDILRQHCWRVHCSKEWELPVCLPKRIVKCGFTCLFLSTCSNDQAQLWILKNIWWAHGQKQYGYSHMCPFMRNRKEKLDLVFSHLNQVCQTVRNAPILFSVSRFPSTHQVVCFMSLWKAFVKWQLYYYFLYII